MGYKLFEGLLKWRAEGGAGGGRGGGEWGTGGDHNSEVFTINYVFFVATEFHFDTIFSQHFLPNNNKKVKIIEILKN